MLLVGTLSVAAQGNPTPITIGENKTGSIDSVGTSTRYTLSVAAPMSVNIQILAISSGFAPNFRVVDPGGIVILDAANPGTQTIAQGSPNLSSPGSYTIEVFSANATSGQFLISVQPGAPLAPPQALSPGQPLNGAVNSQTSRQAFSFSGTPNDVLLLVVSSTSQTAGPVVAVRDADTDETLALSSAGLIGISYRFPASARNYILEVTHGGSSAPEPFMVCVAAENGATNCPGASTNPQIVPTALPTASPFPTLTPSPSAIPTFAPVVINPLGPCQVGSARGLAINVRGGAGTNYNIVGSLPPNGTGLVLGRLIDNSWYQVSVGGIIGWVSGSVVITGGNCAVVSVIILPTATTTIIPPIATTEVSPGLTQTAFANMTATQASINATQSAVPVPVATLNFSLPPVYGSTALTSGFVPDPFTVGVTSGGSANVGYLGGGCSGYTSSAPSFSVNYTSGAFPTLRFYFITSAGDTTMVINTPGGSYVCVDDSFGTINPTIDFNSPSSGRYDVWIGTYADSTTFLGGTLFVTENTGNHP
jgi:uncharacterized protein YraI